VIEPSATASVSSESATVKSTVRTSMSLLPVTVKDSAVASVMLISVRSELSLKVIPSDPSISAVIVTEVKLPFPSKSTYSISPAIFTVSTLLMLQLNL
jgi:hypothetical protein